MKTEVLNLNVKNLLLMILLFITGCYSNKYDITSNEEKGFLVNIYQNNLTGYKLNLVLRNKSSSHNIDFKLENFGRFKVISPDYKRANQIHLTYSKSSSNTMTFSKNNEVF